MHAPTTPTPRPPACEKFRRLVNCYLDGELAPADTLELDAHVAACAACEGTLHTERAFTELIRAGLTEKEMPASACDRLTRSLKWERRRALVRSAGLGIAAALALVLSGIAVYSQIIGRGNAGSIAAREAEFVKNNDNSQETPVAASLRPELVRIRQPNELSANAVAARLHGELVCADCLVSERHGHDSSCLASGHRGALLLATGEIIYFTGDSAPQLLTPRSPDLGHDVQVEGDYLPREKFMAVRNFQLASS